MQKISPVLKLNSESLTELNKDDYFYLFSHSAVVASCPGVWFAEGEHGVLDGGLATCFQTSSRVYVGLEPLKFTNEIQIGEEENDHKRYDPLTGKFIKINPKTAPELAALTEVLKEVPSLRRKSGQGFKVRTLHELRPGVGCNWSGAISTALSAAIMQLDEELSQRDIDSWRSKPGEELVVDPVFNKCHLTGWRLDTRFHRRRASGYGSFCSLISANGPICYYTAERGRKDSKFPLKVDNTNALSEIPYFGFRLEDECDIDEHILDSDIEIALIFTGKTKETAQAIEDIRNETTRENARKLITDIIESTQGTTVNNSLFLKLCKEAEEGDGMRSHYFNSLIINGLEVFTTWYALLVQGMGINNRNLQDLAFATRRLQHQLNQLGLEWWEERAVEYYFYRMTRELGISDLSAVKLTGIGKGGEMVCIMPRIEGIDQRLRQLITEMRQKINPNITLDWLLSRDGLPSSGLKLEGSGGVSVGTLVAQVEKFTPEHTTEMLTLYPSDVHRIKSNAIYLDIDEGVWIKGHKVSFLPFGRIAMALALYKHGTVDSTTLDYVCTEENRASYNSTLFRHRTKQLNDIAKEAGSNLRFIVNLEEYIRKQTEEGTRFKIEMWCSEDVYLLKSPKMSSILSLLATI
jgi:mevalonate kinase